MHEKVVHQDGPIDAKSSKRSLRSAISKSFWAFFKGNAKSVDRAKRSVFPKGLRAFFKGKDAKSVDPAKRYLENRDNVVNGKSSEKAFNPKEEAAPKPVNRFRKYFKSFKAKVTRN